MLLFYANVLEFLLYKIDRFTELITLGDTKEIDKRDLITKLIV